MSKFETNSKHEIKDVRASDFIDFEFRACFGFRYSDFEFLTWFKDP